MNSLDEELDDEARYVKIQQLVETLRLLSTDSEVMGRLHEVEQMIVHDVLAESRHLKCQGCLIWLTRLVEKAKGEV